MLFIKLQITAIHTKNSSLLLPLPFCFRLYRQDDFGFALLYNLKIQLKKYIKSQKSDNKMAPPSK